MTKSKNGKMANEQALPVMTARIDRMIDREDSKIRAYASVNIGGAFALHGIRIFRSEKGMLVMMPQKSYQVNGETKYTDIFHPVTAAARAELSQVVLEAYEQKMEQQENELPDLGPVM